MMQGITIKEEFPPGFLEALGRMVMWFGSIDHAMRIIHTGLGPRGQSVAFLDTERADEFAARCRDLQSLFDAKFADPMQRLALAKMLSKLAPLWRYRSDCIHCIWKPDGEGVAAFRPKASNGKIEWHTHRTTAEKMKEVADSVAVVYLAIDQLSKLSGLSAKQAAAA
jgi:hypothetical protein